MRLSLFFLKLQNSFLKIRLIAVCVLIFFAANTALLYAQSAYSDSAEDSATDESASIVSLNAPEPEISVYIDEQKKESLNICVLYKFPKEFHQTYSSEYFYAAVKSPKEFSSYKIKYPKGSNEDGIINYYDSALLILETNTANISAGSYTLEIEAAYQLCDSSGVCYMPGKKIVTLLCKIEQASPKKAVFETIKYFLLAFFGGMLLNLMPCVLPMLAVRAISIVMQAQEERKKIFLFSLSYAAGVVVSFIIIALLMIILKTPMWGFQMQSREFIIAVSFVVFVFALSMFGMFEIKFNFANTEAKIAKTKSYLSQFLTGIVVVASSSACSAPLVGSAAAFALQKSAGVILLFFIFIGAGFAAPFLIIGLNPAVIKKLPKSGRWNSVLKTVCGFILIIFSVYMIFPVLKNYPLSAIIKTALFFITVPFLAKFLLLQAASVKRCSASAEISTLNKKSHNDTQNQHSIHNAQWIEHVLFPKAAEYTQKLFLLLLLALAIVSEWFFLVDFKETDYSDSKVNENSYTTEGFESAVFSQKLLNELYLQNKAVFVNISAEWCTTCKVNDALVFSSKEVKDFFKNNSIIVLNGDFTTKNNDIAEWMKINQKRGIPVYAFYHPDNDFFSPVFFPEILNKQNFIKKLSEFYLQ